MSAGAKLVDQPGLALFFTVIQAPVLGTKNLEFYRPRLMILSLKCRFSVFKFTTNMAAFDRCWI